MLGAGGMLVSSGPEEYPDLISVSSDLNFTEEELQKMDPIYHYARKSSLFQPFPIFCRLEMCLCLSMHPRSKVKVLVRPK